ncbi:PucR family transcriptional regulator [Psychrobacillus sp. NPDC096389]|uniref:PucR family transcriptional regulator n=1 Tax=Psychrobacillus sp. NPDC096389 TaxID=3364490 RepID=UPI00380D6664
MKQWLSTNFDIRSNSENQEYTALNHHKLLLPKESFSTWKQRTVMENADFEKEIVVEKSQAYEELEKERNQLQMVINIQNALTDELIRSNRVSNILDILKKYIPLPIIIENYKCHITDYENINLVDAKQLQASFHRKLKEWAIKKTEFLELDNHCRLVSPIYLQNQILGYCSFIYDSDNPKSNDIDRMILGRLTSICAMVYLNNKNILEANARTKGILFEKILADEFESKEQIYRELQLLNIDVSGKYHIALISLKYNSYIKEENLSIFTSVYEEVIQFFQEKDYEVLLVQRANGILCFIPEDGDHASLKNGPIEFCMRIKQNHPKIQCHVGVSSTDNDLQNVNSLMKEAMTAARFTANHQPTKYFRELGILGILVHTQEETAIKKIAEIELGSIYGQTEQQKEYMLTLYEFLINGGNLEQTSTKLKLSISGLRYRINKIREILQDDLKDSQKQFDFLLALKALKVIGEF